jgi:hypothetical protein
MGQGGKVVRISGLTTKVAVLSARQKHSIYFKNATVTF